MTKLTQNSSKAVSLSKVYMNFRKSVAFAMLTAFGAGVLFVGTFVFAETMANPAVVGERRAQLEAELESLEAEIAGIDKTIDSVQKETASLERDVAILNAEIRRAQLAIKAQTLTIGKLQDQITEKTRVIGALGDKYERELESLAEMLRQLNELSDISEVEIIFKYDDLSKYFEQVDSLDYLQKGLQDSFDEIRVTKEQTETERTELEDRKQEESELLTIRQLEKRGIEEKERAKKKLLADTRGKEKEYQKLMTARQQDAAKIRSQLFILQGSAAIPFEKALEYANRAYDKTGIRPAFLLAIITQETKLGSYIGQCNKPDDQPKYKWYSIMPGPEHYKNYVNNGKRCRGAKSPCSYRDDQTIYLSITGKLGLSADSMPLSCPQSVGFGGGMGPAQFIPTTWAAYEAKIAKMTGHGIPNPWDPEDALMASAIYLSELGANKRTSSAESEAAARYFGGSNWKLYLNSYARSVASLARDYQEQIDILSGQR